MAHDIQVVAISNSFELVYRDELPYALLTDLARIDELHFGQKSAFWWTDYGWPDVVITTRPPSEEILKATYRDQSCPRFVLPFRESSSICLDLLADVTAWQTFISSLDRNKSVFLAPYVHTPALELLAASLLSNGFRLCDYRPQATLVSKLWNKVYVQRAIFEQNARLRSHRPMAIVAMSDRAVRRSATLFKRRGIRQLVIKSNAAVGGAGVV